jgi:predicted AlkP superfamily pyrophosphatase or phosphodiesterase
MLPVDHGIFADYKFDEVSGIESGEKYSQASEIKTETIWDVASRAGLATAAAGYPLTSGAQIGFNVPAGQKVEAIIDIIDKQQPNLLLINFTSLEQAQATFGPDSREAIAALEGIDSQIQEIARASPAEETTFVIVSDAGRVRVERELHPNAVLAKKGLLTIDGQNRITSWRAICQALGGAAAVFVKNEQDQKLIAEVEKTFREIHDRSDSPIWRIIDRRDAARLGADPRAWFFLDAAPLYRMGSGAAGRTVSGASVRASSGYLPQRSELRAALILAGNGVKPGVRIEYARLIDIAPTVVRLLGLEMRSARGRVLNEVLAGGS